MQNAGHSTGCPLDNQRKGGVAQSRILHTLGRRRRNHLQSVSGRNGELPGAHQEPRIQQGFLAKNAGFHLQGRRHDKSRCPVSGISGRKNRKQGQTL